MMHIETLGDLIVSSDKETTKYFKTSFLSDYWVEVAPRALKELATSHPDVPVIAKAYSHYYLPDGTRSECPVGYACLVGGKIVFEDASYRRYGFNGNFVKDRVEIFGMVGYFIPVELAEWQNEL